jgi:hypothetical protein
MANNRNHDLEISIDQNKENIQQVIFDISSINSRFAQFQDQVQHNFEAMDTKFTSEFDTLKYVFNQLLN